MKTLVGIQARSSSTRLPKKIFMDIFGVPMLERVYNACKKANVGDVTVIGPKDDTELQEWCKGKEIPCVCPDVPSDDLVSRYVEASKGYEVVVRVTSDCPMMEPLVIQQAVKLLEKNDYACNTIFRTMPDGVDIQACKRPFLEWVDRTQQAHREHPFFMFDMNEMVRAGTGWKVGQLLDLTNQALLKISVDTEKDLEFVRKLIEAREGKIVKV